MSLSFLLSYFPAGTLSMLRRHNALKAFAVATIVLVLLLPEFARAVLYTCDTTNAGVLQLTNQALASATFSILAGCVSIIIDGTTTTADSITFPALTSIAISIQNVACSAATSPGTATCVSFSSTVSGGSININGLTRTISGTTVGTYSIVQFVGAVTNVPTINIRGLTLTTSVSTGLAGNAALYPVHFAAAVAGSGTAGSILNVSGHTWTSGSTWATAPSGNAVVHILQLDAACTAFEVVELSGHAMAGSINAATNGEAMVLFVSTALTLTGSAASRIVLRATDMRGLSVAASTGYAYLMGIYGPAGGPNTISSVSEIIVQDVDFRGTTLSSTSSGVQVRALYVRALASLSMVVAGKIELRRIWIGGSATSVGASDEGVRVMELQSTNGGIREITVAECSIDMATGAGLTTSSGFFNTQAAIVHFQSAISLLGAITISNASIRGKYVAAAFIHLHILRVSNTLSAGSVSIVDSGVYSTTPADGGPIEFSNTVSNTAMSVQNFACGTVSKPLSTCVYFTGVSGGSISINGLTRAISGTATGTYRLVFFSGAVSLVSAISISGLALTASVTSSTNVIEIYAVVFALAVAGSGAGGSALNITSSSISGSLSNTLNAIRVQMARFESTVSAFESVEFTSNSMDGLTVLSSAAAEVVLARFVFTVTLTGTAASGIALRSNNMRSITAQSAGVGAPASIVLVSFSDTVSQVSRLVVDRADMRSSVITSPASSAYFAAVHFVNFAMLSMVVGSGLLTVKDAWLGGRMTNAVVNGDQYGAAVVRLAQVNAAQVSITNAGIDMGATGGLAASGAGVKCLAYVLNVAVAPAAALDLLAMTNCSIRGVYSSAADSVELNILKLDTVSLTAGITSASLSGNEIVPATASGATSTNVHIARFSAVTGAGVSPGINCSKSRIAGTFSAGSGAATLSVLWLGGAVTALEYIEASENSLDGITASSTSSSAALYGTWIGSSVALSNNAAARLVMRANVARSVVMTSVGTTSTFTMLHMQAAATLSQIATLEVVQADMRGADLAGNDARYRGFYASSGGASIAMVAAGGVSTIRFDEILLGGRYISSSAANPRIAEFQAVSDAALITISDSSMDFATGVGAETSTTTLNAFAVVFNSAVSLTGSAKLAMENCSLRGFYRTTSAAAVSLSLMSILSTLTASEISILGNNIAPTTATATMGSLDIYLFVASGTITGSGAIGSKINISNNALSSANALSGSSVLAAIARFGADVSGSFEALDCSGNSISTAEMPTTLIGSSSYARGYILRLASLSLTAAAASVFAMRNNLAYKLTVTAAGSSAEIDLLIVDISKSLSNVAAFVIDRYDAREVTMTATCGGGCLGRHSGVLFQTASSLSLSGGTRSVLVNEVLLGGQITFALYSVDYSARAAYFQNVFSATTLTLSNSLLDMSTGTGLSTPYNSQRSQAHVFEFANAPTVATSLTVTNNSVRGVISASGGSSMSHVRVLYVASGSLSTPIFAATRNNFAGTVTATSEARINLLAFWSQPVGGFTAGSVFNVSDSLISGSCVSSSGLVSVVVAHLAAGSSGFETSEMSGNVIMSGFSASAAGGGANYVEVHMLLLGGAFSAAATVDSALIARDNTARGLTLSTVSGAGSYILLQLIRIDGATTNIRKIIVSRTDFRDVAVTAETYLRITGALYFSSGAASLTMNNGGGGGATMVEVSDILVTGSASAKATGATFYGINVARFGPVASVDSISITSSTIDMGTASGYVTTNFVSCLARIADFSSTLAVATIRVETNLIKGLYSSSWDLQLHVMYVASTITGGNTLLSIKDNMVTGVTVSAPSNKAAAYIAGFFNSISTATAALHNNSIISNSFNGQSYTANIALFQSSVTASVSVEIIGNRIAAVTGVSTSGTANDFILVSVASTLTTADLSVRNNALRDCSISSTGAATVVGVLLNGQVSVSNAVVIDQMDMRLNTLSCRSNSFFYGLRVASGPFWMSTAPGAAANISISSVLLSGTIAHSSSGSVSIGAVKLGDLRDPQHLSVRECSIDFNAPGSSVAAAGTITVAIVELTGSSATPLQNIGGTGISFRNATIRGRFSTTGTVDAKILMFASGSTRTLNNISSFTVSDCAISGVYDGKQGANVGIARFPGAVTDLAKVMLQRIDMRTGGLVAAATSAACEVVALRFDGAVSSKSGSVVASDITLGGIVSGGSGVARISVLAFMSSVSSLALLNVSDSVIDTSLLDCVGVTYYAAARFLDVTGASSDIATIELSRNVIRGAVSASGVASTAHVNIASFGGAVTDVVNILLKNNMFDTLTVSASSASASAELYVFENVLQVNSSISLTGSKIAGLWLSSAANSDTAVLRVAGNFFGALSLLHLADLTVQVPILQTTTPAGILTASIARLVAGFDSAKTPSLTDLHVLGCTVTVSQLDAPPASMQPPVLSVFSVGALPASLASLLVVNNTLLLPPTSTAPALSAALLRLVQPSPLLSASGFAANITGNALRSVSAPAPLAWCTPANCSIFRVDTASSALLRGKYFVTKNSVDASVASFVNARPSAWTASALLHIELNTALSATAQIYDTIGASSCCTSLAGSAWTVACNYIANVVRSRFKARYISTADSIALTCRRTQSVSISQPRTRSRTDLGTQTQEMTDSRSKAALPPIVFSSTTHGLVLPGMPVHEYGTIHPGLTQFTTATAPPPPGPGTTTLPASYNGFAGTINTLNGNMNGLVSAISGLGAAPSTIMPLKVTLSAAAPELGSFFALADRIPAGVTFSIGPLGDNITFTAYSAAALATAIRDGYVFNPSEEVKLRNMTTGAYYIKADVKDAGNQSGRAVFPIDKLPLVNRGPETNYTAPSTALMLNVSRGHRFDLDLGNVFIHRTPGMQMQFAIADTQGFPLPVTLLITCISNGQCQARGAVDLAANPVRAVIQATDGFILRSAFITFVPFAVPIRPSNSTFAAPLLRPGVLFQYALPSDMFVSSTRIAYTAVVRPDGVALPAGTLVFEAPNLIRGTWQFPGPLALQLQAQDLFYRSARNFTLVFGNTRPVCNATAANMSLASVVALQEFTRTVDVTALCADPEEDAVEFTVLQTSVPSWLWAEIVPGGGATTAPQKLILTGNPDRDAPGKTFDIVVVVREFFASSSVQETVRLTLPLLVVPNSPPLLRKALPNITVNPDESERRTVLIADYFSDAQSDAMVPSVKIRGAAGGFIALTVITSQPNPSFTIIASPVYPEPEQTVFIDVFVTDAVGAVSRTHTIEVAVVWTTWQKVQDGVYAAVAIFCAAVVAITGLWWFPFLVNTCKRKSLIIQCPLSAAHPRHTIPPETVTCVYQVRDKSKVSDCLVKTLPGFWSDQITFVDTYDGAVPPWLDLADFVLELKPPARKYQSRVPTITFRCFCNHGFLLQQFDVDYAEVTKDWDFDHSYEPPEHAGIDMPAGSGGGGGFGMQQRMEKMEKQHAAELRSVHQQQTTMQELIRRMLSGEKVDARDAALLGPTAAAAARPPPPAAPQVVTAPSSSAHVSLFASAAPADYPVPSTFSASTATTVQATRISSKIPDDDDDLFSAPPPPSSQFSAAAAAPPTMLPIAPAQKSANREFSDSDGSFDL